MLHDTSFVQYVYETQYHMSIAAAARWASAQKQKKKKGKVCA